MMVMSIVNVKRSIRVVKHDLLAGAAVIAGAGFSGFVDTGHLQGESAIAGFGFSRSIGSGNMQAGAALVGGAGSVSGVATSVSGTGALVPGAAVVSGAGTSRSTGSAAIAAGAAAVSGSGVVSTLISYANPLGTGNRAAISITTNAAAGAGTLDNLVDGAFGDNTTDSYWWNAGQSGRRVTFDIGAAEIITEAKHYADVTTAHGTWKWQASNTNDDIDWVDLSATFTLSGSTAGTVAGNLASNTTAYRYYSLLQTAGTTSSTPWQREWEFKISNLAPASTTSYANSGGLGNRASLITAQAMPLITGGGVVADLVNGVTTSGIVPPSGATTFTLAFDFRPSGFKQIVNEIRIRNELTTAQGTFLLEGWDGNGWTTLATGISLGGATARIVSFTNATGYYIYRFRQTAGAMSNASRISEVEFKIAQGTAASSATTSYANTNGTGNRTGSITTSGDMAVSSGTLAALVNGVTNSGACQYSSAQQGKYIQWDIVTAKAIDEIKYYQGNGDAHGNAYFQGSNDGTTFEDIGAFFQWDGTGPFVAKTFNAMRNNVKAYRYYRLQQIGTSGTSGSATPAEFEFKIAA